MPPVDTTPNIDRNNFELVYRLNAFDKIPITEYKSRETGLTVVIAEVEGPVVNGFFCLATEAFDDDGLPHTLEHLIFLGSEDYPYKGVLDLLANRCLASGTNAWTNVDTTCYTLETAGSEGFLNLLPIYLDHILYPVLSDESFVTEVHHITSLGTDAGVVYCEMQGRENSAESRKYLTLCRNMFAKCGYSSETGGIMKNLRESTNNEKVRNFHKDFYRPENLKIIIIGQVNAGDVFGALEKVEQKIISKGSPKPFQRPWQSPVPPLSLKCKDILLKYPADEEDQGLFSISWRGPSNVTDYYLIQALEILLTYLNEYSVSPLPKELIEIDDPYGSSVSYDTIYFSILCSTINVHNVPVQKLPEVGTKIKEILKKILDDRNLDMDLMRIVINKAKQENLSSLENAPHYSIAFLIIAHMVYGVTREHLQQRFSVLEHIDQLSKEPIDFWLGILDKYFVNNECLSIQCFPSIEEQQSMANEEKERISKQIEALQESGLKEKGDILKKAIEFNEREPPLEIITSVPVASVNSVKYHSIQGYASDSTSEGKINLSNNPLFTYFDHVNTNFVYIFAALDTSKVPTDLKMYLPLLREALLELPMDIDGEIIPYDVVVARLNDDTVSSSVCLGLATDGGYGNFECGSYSSTFSLKLQVEVAKYEIGLKWLRQLLYNTIFTVDRIRIIANKMNNSVAQFKREERSVISYLMKGLRFSEDSNLLKNGVLQQNKFLTEIISKLDSESGTEVIEKLESVRKIITDPANLVLHIAANIDLLKDPVTPIIEFLPPNIQIKEKQARLNAIPEYKLRKERNEPQNGCIVGMGCSESSFFVQTAPSIYSFQDPDYPALMLYLQYFTQTEGPMWKQIRGKGYSYGYGMWAKVRDGLLYLTFTTATNVVGAYEETKDILTKQLENKIWDKHLIESAKSSIISEIIFEEKTIGDTINLSYTSNFDGVEYTFNRKLVESINKVTEQDLNRVGEKYIARLFDPTQAKTVVVANPAKISEIADKLKKLGLDLTIYNSLEESFISKI